MTQTKKRKNEKPHLIALKEMVLKFPNTPHLTLAKAFVKKYPKFYLSVEQARTQIRVLKGSLGKTKNTLFGRVPLYNKNVLKPR